MAIPFRTAATLFEGRHAFVLKRLHSLTGLVFGGYLVVHLIVNATVAQGGRMYQLQVDKLESLPFLWLIEWTLIYLPILFHTIYGVRIILTGQVNVLSYPYGGNWRYVLQRASTIIIALFLLFHVLSLRFNLLGQTLSFDAENATYTTWRHVNAHWSVAFLVYPIGVLASCFHLANGLWTAAIAWGLTVGPTAQRRWLWICTFVFVATLGFGMAALVTLVTMRAPPSVRL